MCCGCVVRVVDELYYSSLLMCTFTNSEVSTELQSVSKHLILRCHQCAGEPMMSTVTGWEGGSWHTRTAIELNE